MANYGLVSESSVNPAAVINNAFGDINLYSPLAPAVILADFTNKKFVFMHSGCKSITGYDSQYFTESGIESFLEKIHPVDFSRVNKEIFHKNMSVLQEIPTSDMYNYIFCHSYRMKNKEGKYTTILQRLSYLLSEDNKPTGAVGHLTDISMVCSGEKMVHRIEHAAHLINRPSNEIIFERHFFHNPENQIISKREFEILKWICDGISSSQIAEKLSISTNTVNNHKKKIRQKTNCKNAAELLKYAASQRMI